MEDHMRRAQEAIDRFQRDFPRIQDDFRWFLANVPNLTPEVVEALHRLENFAWPDHDFDLVKQTIASLDMSAVRRSREDRAQGSEGNLGSAHED